MAVASAARFGSYGGSLSAPNPETGVVVGEDRLDVLNSQDSR
jgi:hypothetical protein